MVRKTERLGPPPQVGSLQFFQAPRCGDLMRHQLQEAVAVQITQAHWNIRGPGSGLEKRRRCIKIAFRG